MKRADRFRGLYSALFGMAVSLFFFFGVDAKRRTFGDNSISGATFPRICAIGVMILSVLILVQWYAQFRKTKAEAASGEAKKEGWLKKYSQVLCVALILVWMLLIEPLGFIVATMLYIPFQMYLLSLDSKRNWVVIAIMAVVLPIAVYFLFRSVFNVMIPRGILSGIL